jgi:hypothetical protein
VGDEVGGRSGPPPGRGRPPGAARSPAGPVRADRRALCAQGAAPGTEKVIFPPPGPVLARDQSPRYARHSGGGGPAGGQDRANPLSGPAAGDAGTPTRRRHPGCVIDAASRITASAAHRLHCRRMGVSRRSPAAAVEGQPLIQAVVDPRRQALDGEAIFAGAGRAQPGGRAGKGSIDLSHRVPGDQHLQRVRHGTPRYEVTPQPENSRRAP